MSWPELVAFADDVFDVWDLLLVGYRAGERPPARGTFEDLSGRCEVVAEVFDSSSVRISARSDEFEAAIKRVFPSAERVSG